MKRGERGQVKSDGKGNGVGIKVDGTYVKWTTKELRQIQTADPVGMDRKSCLYTFI